MKLDKLFAMLFLVVLPAVLTYPKSSTAEEPVDSQDEFLDFASPQGKQLLAKAAAMPAQIMRDLANSSEPPEKNLPATQPLTYLLLYSKYPKNAYEKQELSFNNIADFGAATVDLESDTVNALLSKNIKQVTFAGSPSRVTGIVEFSAADVLHGKVTFVAVHEETGWKVIEFAMPARGQRTVLKPDGTWKMSAIESAALKKN